MATRQQSVLVHVAQDQIIDHWSPRHDTWQGMGLSLCLSLSLTHHALRTWSFMSTCIYCVHNTYTTHVSLCVSLCVSNLGLNLYF